MFVRLAQGSIHICANPTHYQPNTPIIVETNTSDYTITGILSNICPDSKIHLVAFYSRMLTVPELNYDMHDKELLAIFEAFHSWRHYLEGSALPVDVVTDHKNLIYFSTSKVLTRCQARWSEYLSQFNLIIRFRPGKLGMKPNALTRCWDVYPKEGDKGFTCINPQNLHPVFTTEQLNASLRATHLQFPILRASTLMDIKQLHNNILFVLPSDPVAQIHLSDTSHPRWSIDVTGLLHLDSCIFVPKADDLHLRVLRFKHDHPLLGHYGQSHTLDLVQRKYTWPGVRMYVKDYVKSCTACARAKTPHHRPYGMLKQLPIPERPWNSIFMDFIEQLPVSSGFTAILVVVDRLLQQALFIPTHDTITSPELTQLFLLHVFSKHSIPAHVTSDHGMEFISHFFRSLEKALDMKLHFGLSPQR